VRLTERHPNGCSLQRAPRSRCRLDAEASNTPPLIALTGTSEDSPGRARAYLVQRNHRDLAAHTAGLRGHTPPAGQKRRVESASLSCPWSRVQSSIASASAADAHHPGVEDRGLRALSWDFPALRRIKRQAATNAGVPPPTSQRLQVFSTS